MPDDASKNLKQHLDARVNAENAYDTEANPFAGFLARQKEAYTENKMAAWRAQSQNNSAAPEQIAAQSAQFRNEFDENKLPGLLDDLKKKTVASYNGKDDIKIEGLVGSVTGGALTGNLMNMAMGGGLGGLFTSLHHAVGGFILGLPFVGDLIGTATTWLKSKFSGDTPLSWAEARQAFQSDRTRKHMAESMAQYADMDKLNEIVDNAVAGKAPPEIKKPVASVAVPSNAKLRGVTGGTAVANPEEDKAPTPVSTETANPKKMAEHQEAQVAP